MIASENINDLVRDYSGRLVKILQQGKMDRPKTYGFEYEFIAGRPLSLARMKELFDFLPICGFKPEPKGFISSSGMLISFEPGGQIEYGSPPLLSHDTDSFHRLLESIEKTNSAIRQNLGIDYKDTGYLPGREDAPLCLTSDRYKKLNDRFLKTGTRGLEMMKGTASIHLHMLIRDIRELSPVFYKLRDMASSEEFRMSDERRNVWDHTDNDRCGQPYGNTSQPLDSTELLDEMVCFALNAETIGENIPFRMTNGFTFDAFLDHLTTLFTDIRFNIKGPSLELRTLDSMPLNSFVLKWEKFISILENE